MVVGNQYVNYRILKLVGNWSLNYLTSFQDKNIIVVNQSIREDEMWPESTAELTDEQMVILRDKGFTYRRIASVAGISHQRVRGRINHYLEMKRLREELKNLKIGD